MPPETLIPADLPRIAASRSHIFAQVGWAHLGDIRPGTRAGHSVILAAQAHYGLWNVTVGDPLATTGTVGLYVWQAKPGDGLRRPR